MNQSFASWWERLLDLADSRGYDVEDMTESDWISYYNDGYSPREALDEDETYFGG